LSVPPEKGLKERLDKLLGLASAEKNDITRADLLLAWCRAENAESRKLAPKSDLENRISEVIKLLSDLHKYLGSEHISIQAHQIGAGIIDISPLPNVLPSRKVRDAADPGGVWQVTASDLVERLKARDSNDRELLKEAAAEIERLRNGWAIIRMPELLKAWLECVKKMPYRKRGQPPREWDRQIVREAAAFAFRHSAPAPSNDRKNPFRSFVPEFYKWVTGVVDAETGFTGLIKEVLAEFHSEPDLIDAAK
jgi:hypothetical protein